MFGVVKILFRNVFVGGSHIWFRNCLWWLVDYCAPILHMTGWQLAPKWQLCWHRRRMDIFPDHPPPHPHPIYEMWLLFMKEYNTEIDAVRHLVIEKSNQTEKSIYQDYLWSFQNFKFIQNAPISPWSTGLRRKMHNTNFLWGQVLKITIHQ